MPDRPTYLVELKPDRRDPDIQAIHERYARQFGVVTDAPLWLVWLLDRRVWRCIAGAPTVSAARARAVRTGGTVRGRGRGAA